MFLAKGEEIVRSWDYSSSKGKVKSKTSLTVTNKRIVSIVEGKKSLSREEIPLSSIESVSGSVSSPKVRVVMIILGIWLAIALIGIFILVHEFGRSNTTAFELTLRTHRKDQEGKDFELYSSSVKPKKNGLFSRLFKRKTKIIVKREMVTEILETIGTVILNEQIISA